MYQQLLDVSSVALDFACEIERMLPTHYDFDYESFWELIECGFLDDSIQDPRNSDLFDHFSEHLPTDIVTNIFLRVLAYTNHFLNYRVPSRFRRVPPTSVYYVKSGTYRLLWRVTDEPI